MMPFILSGNFEDCKLPEYLRPYWPFIEGCSHDEQKKIDSNWFHAPTSQIGKVCYLTVQESAVESGHSQRRPGLHVDCPGYVKLKPMNKGTKRTDLNLLLEVMTKGTIISKLRLRKSITMLHKTRPDTRQGRLGRGRTAKIACNAGIGRTDGPR